MIFSFCLNNPQYKVLLFSAYNISLVKLETMQV